MLKFGCSGALVTSKEGKDGELMLLLEGTQVHMTIHVAPGSNHQELWAIAKSLSEQLGLMRKTPSANQSKMKKKRYKTSSGKCLMWSKVNKTN